MIGENNHWSVDCDQCGEDLDTSEFEVDGVMHDIEEVYDYIKDYTDWIVDDDGNVFCCEECHQAWLEDNTDNESEDGK